MICPRCSVGEISETTQECLVCGFSPDGNVMVDAAEWNPLDDPVITALERQFQVEGVLRRGTASRIYLARDQLSGRLCSLKVLPLAPFSATSLIERFRQDAQRAADLDHPHLVAVDRFGVTDEALWYAMEYVQGRSLGDLLPAAEPMELKTCLRLVEQIASALEYGHRRGLVHGNLKPSNVLVDPEGWVRVADFGVNGAFGPLPRRQPELSYEDNYGHTAPEQFGAHGSVGPAADQYALAVLVFTCLARRLPFPGDTLEEITLAHLEGPIPRLAESRPELPDFVTAALVRAMSRDPAGRYAGVLDFATALAGVALPQPAPIAAPAAATIAAERPPAAATGTPEPQEKTPEPEPEPAPVANAAPPISEPEEETEETEAEPEPETESEPAGASTGAPAPAGPAHPPLLFIERRGGVPGEEDLEDLDEEEDADLAALARSPEESASAGRQPDHAPAEPLLLWRASREQVVASPSAAGTEGQGADGESPDAAPPLLFLDKSLPTPRRGWEAVAARGAERLQELTVRWRALPRNMRIGSGAGAGVLVLLLAVVWWRVARGHEEPRADWVGEAPPVALGDSTPAARPEPRSTPPRRRPEPRRAVPAVPGPSSGADSTAAGGTAGSRPTSPAVEPAHLFLNATPWGIVFVDDKQVGHTPMEALVKPGYHVIRITRDGYEPFQREVAVESGEALRLTDIVLQEKSP